MEADTVPEEEAKVEEELDLRRRGQNFSNRIPATLVEHVVTHGLK